MKAKSDGWSEYQDEIVKIRESMSRRSVVVVVLCATVCGGKVGVNVIIIIILIMVSSAFVFGSRRSENHDRFMRQSACDMIYISLSREVIVEWEADVIWGKISLTRKKESDWRNRVQWKRQDKESEGGEEEWRRLKEEMIGFNESILQTEPPPTHATRSLHSIPLVSACTSSLHVPVKKQVTGGWSSDPFVLVHRFVCSSFSSSASSCSTLRLYA